MFTKRAGLLITFLVLTLVISSCSSPADSEPKNLDTQAILPGSETWSIDKKFVEVAQEVPGFGGAFYDENGDINVYLLNSSKKEQAKAALSAVFGANLLTRDRDHPLWSPRLPKGEVKVLQGKYDFATLAQWRRRADDHVFSYPGVIFTDVDERNNRVLIGVESEETAVKVGEKLADLNVPDGAVGFEVGEVESTLTLNDRVRPVVGGVATSPAGGGACTLGFNAYHYSLNAYGFVTNSHCSSSTDARDSTRYYQGGDYISDEIRDYSGFTGGSCPSGSRCRYSDSNFVRYRPSISNSRRYAVTKQRAGISTSDPLEIYRTERIDGSKGGLPDSDWVGVRLHKVGRTTGDTEGAVANSCANFERDNSNVILLCQTRVRANQEPGDSGSPVLRTSSVGDIDTLYGIAWGRYWRFTITGKRVYFIFSSFQGVESDLGNLDVD